MVVGYFPVGCAGSGDWLVEGVSFDGLEAGFSDGALQTGGIGFLMGVGSAYFGDVVPDDGAVDVICSCAEHEFRHFECLHYPECFDMGEVIEH